MRTVKVLSKKYIPWKSPEEPGHFVVTEIGKAKFHQFGVAYEEFGSGIGNYTTAIIENDDGSVSAVEVDCIIFED